MKKQIRLTATTIVLIAMTIVLGCTKPDNPNNPNNGGSGGGNSGGGGDETVELPIVKTAEITEVSETGAIGGGNVESDGGATVTERGICWSTEQMPTTDDRHTSSGTGTGTYTCELTDLNPTTTYYVRAYATNSKGTNYGDEVSFVTEDIPYYPTGAINGLFSVSNGKQVYFSQGNLQYQASTNTFRFAAEQYEHTASSNSDWISHFGWATSGWNPGGGVTAYLPSSTDINDDSYFFYGNLTGNYANADWGVYNPIINGGNLPNQWRTLTSVEWKYVFNSRRASSIGGVNNARYAKAKIGIYPGIILFPDNYSHPSGVSIPVAINDEGTTGWTRNKYSYSDWNKMEKAGAVFLPADGYYDGISGYGIHVLNNPSGLYWSATRYNPPYQIFKCSMCVFFAEQIFSQADYSHRIHSRMSVRLVQDAE